MENITLKTEAESSFMTIPEQSVPERYAAYIGLDVHKDTIAVAIALPGRKAAYFDSEISHKKKSIAKLIQRLSEQFGGQLLLFCYEAGPCGYGVHRQIVASGHECEVIAPSKMPRKPGDRVKTDRLDACKLAQYLRAGELTAIWIPSHEQEGMRDLTRARGDMKILERKARQQLNQFVLRHAHHWPSDKSRWTQAHYKWLESLSFEHEWQGIVLQEYLQAARAASQRVADLNGQLERALSQWSLAPVVDALVALRGIDKLSAMILLSELGDLRRFESPKQAMAYVGLVPSEHSSGPRRRQGAITLMGNEHARRILVESAWSYRFVARQTAHLKRKAANASTQAKAIAWRAQKRLCGRYRTLIQAGKNTKQTVVAVARELLGFIWDIVCQEMNKLKFA